MYYSFLFEKKSSYLLVQHIIPCWRGGLYKRRKEQLRQKRTQRRDLHGLYNAATYPSVHFLFSVKFGFARRRKIHLSPRSGSRKLHTHRTPPELPLTPLHTLHPPPPIYLLLYVCPRYHGACVVYHPLSPLSTPLHFPFPSDASSPMRAMGF